MKTNMAIWQYTFHLLPAISVEALGKDLIVRRDEDGLYDDEPFWKYNPTNKSLFLEIGKMLSKNKSWSKYIDQYGNLESNYFEILFEDNDFVSSASFRIDYTTEYDTILNMIIEFCILNGMKIFDEKWDIVPNNLESIKSVIENSSQLKTYKRLSRTN
jgi:hypothetical protein